MRPLKSATLALGILASSGADALPHSDAGLQHVDTGGRFPGYLRYRNGTLLEPRSDASGELPVT